MKETPYEDEEIVGSGFALYLVEAGYFKTVNFVFYIVGHTKNAADRWFNILKKQY